MKTGKLIIISLLLICSRLNAQTCATALGDQVTYGSNDTWIGYVYDNLNFNNYYGYVNEGTPGNMNFDQSFGGDYATFATNGCAVYAETFSIRYLLNKTFVPANYTFTVGGDDGYRFSVDGGANWIINNWGDHGYGENTVTVFLSGSTNLVVEYYENGQGNRIRVNFQTTCVAIDDESIYGTNDVWRGYVYDNMDFTAFKGVVLEGTAGNSYFDQNFGNVDDGYFNTNSCSVNTQTFSIRYRLRKTFTNQSITFLVGGDDGYRLSLNGGSSWVIDNWNDHGYGTTNYTVTLNGTYDMVLEYYENAGASRVSFDLNSIALPVELLYFNGSLQNNQIRLNWATTLNSNTNEFAIEKSSNGSNYIPAGQLKAAAGIITATGIQYSFTDPVAFTGTQYYRLKIIDKNGVISYSEVITLKNNTNSDLKVYPTVLHAGNQLVLETSKQLENLTISITDIMGRPVAQQHLPVLNNQTTIELKNNLTKGLYMVMIRNIEGVLLNQKIVVQ